MNPIARKIFISADDHILNYLSDDGIPVEPMYYAPIIPMVLINGVSGIGTGFSTDILSYNPIDIIRYLKKKLEEQQEQYGQSEKKNYDMDTALVVEEEFMPYYEGFTGSISKISETKYLIKEWRKYN